MKDSTSRWKFRPSSITFLLSNHAWKSQRSHFRDMTISSKIESKGCFRKDASGVGFKYCEQASRDNDLCTHLHSDKSGRHSTIADAGNAGHGYPQSQVTDTGTHASGLTTIASFNFFRSYSRVCTLELRSKARLDLDSSPTLDPSSAPIP